MFFTGLLICLLAGLAAFGVALLVRRHAGALGLVAVPNARSSHSRPTPSGGGLGIVLGGSIAMAPLLWLQPWPMLPLLAAALALGGIGLLDDRRPVPAGMRLGAQLLLLLLAVVLLLPPPLAGLSLPARALMVALLVLAGTYWVNLFNFMDGIDGLAAGEAVFLCLAAALLALTGTADVANRPEFWWLLGLASASLGFLVLNWPPARIFMGDAGSTYLGYVLALLALVTIGTGWLGPWQWLILAALFITDATVTLLRRLFRRERLFEAHRRHAYQVLARRWGSHRRVTLAALTVNLLWLLPLALLAGQERASGPLLALLAYLPLVLLALRLGAGAPEVRLGDS